MGSGDCDSLTPENVACRICDRASGTFDVRHVVNASAVYELPFGDGKPYLSSPGVLRRRWRRARRVVAAAGRVVAEIKIWRAEKRGRLRGPPFLLRLASCIRRRQLWGLLRVPYDQPSTADTFRHMLQTRLSPLV